MPKCGGFMPETKAERMSRPERSSRPFEERLGEMVKERNNLLAKRGRIVLSTRQALRLHKLEQIIGGNIQAVPAS